MHFGYSAGAVHLEQRCQGVLLTSELQDFNFGVKLSIALLSSPLRSPLWNTGVPELFCQRESPQKQQNGLKKKKGKPNAIFSVHCGRDCYLGRIFSRKLLKPGLAAGPKVTELSLCPWSGKEHWHGEQRLFLHWVHKGSFLDHKRVVFLSSPS